MSIGIVEIDRVEYPVIDDAQHFDAVSFEVCLVDGTSFSENACRKSICSIFWYQRTVSLASLHR